MNRFRGTDVALGLVAVAVNIGLVVGVVAMTSRGEPADVAASASATPSATPTPTGTPSSTPSPSPSAPSLRSLFTGDEPVTLAVLGDQTSDGEAEWVGVMAALLGEEHRVVLRDLDPSDPTVYASERSYGSSGSKISIRNASRAGVNADYAARRLPLLVPVEADVVILNYGRNDQADDVATRLEKTAKAVRSQLPQARVLVTLQPPTVGDGQKDTRDAVRRWAKSSDLTTIDAAAAFRRTGDPDSFVSTRDPLVMTSAGDELWGREVYRILTGRRPVVSTSPSPTGTTEAAGPAGSVGGTGGGGGIVEPEPSPTTPGTPAPEPTDVDPSPTGSPSPSGSPSTTSSGDGALAPDESGGARGALPIVGVARAV